MRTTIDDKVINFDESYEALFQFISKNKELPMMVQQADIVLTEKLLAAINAGLFDDPIFDDRDCDIFLLRLFKDKKIPRATFLTIYTLLMAKMDDDTVQAQLAPILDERGSLTPAGENYFQELAMSLKEKFGFVLDQDKLISYIKTQPISERMLLIVRSKDTGDDGLDILVIENTYSYFQRMKDEGDFRRYCLPSFAIIVYISTFLTDKPVKLLPGFGSVGNDTLYRMHKMDHHFYPLFNRYVKSSMKIAHVRYHDPFWHAVHDIYHMLAASLVDRMIRMEILDFIPILLKGYAQFYPDQPHREKISRLVLGDGSLNDLNFNSSQYYINKNSILERYLISCLSCHADFRIMFFELLLQMRYSKEYSKSIDVLERLIVFFLDRNNFYFSHWGVYPNHIVEDNYAAIEALYKKYTPSVALYSIFKDEDQVVSEVRKGDGARLAS